MLPFFLLALLLVSCREIVEKEAGEKLAIAEAALQEERWEEADSAFYEAILLDPDRAEAWIGRGMTLTHLSNPDYARSHYQEALDLYRARLEEEPDHQGALRRSLMLLVLLNHGEEARELADRALREHPDREFARGLPGLVEEIESEFAELILPPPTSDESASPFDSDPLRAK